MTRIIQFLLVGYVSILAGQFSLAEQPAAPKKPCEMPEGKQLDFWVGEWELSWPAGQGDAPEGQPGKGTNTVRKILGNCIVQENFEYDSADYRGMSVSAYKPSTGKWEQTWVDSGGNYLLFTGEFKNGVMELRSPKRTHPDGTTVMSRMVFKNITRDSFDWDYQISKDEGKTWADNWNIHYVRKK